MAGKKCPCGFGKKASEKKYGLNAIMMASAIAAGTAAGVVLYLKREEIRRLADYAVTKAKEKYENFRGSDDLFDDDFEDEDLEVEAERDIVLQDTDEAAEKAGEAAEKAEEAVEKAVDAAEDAAEDAIGALKDAVEEAVEDVQDAVGPEGDEQV